MKIDVYTATGTKKGTIDLPSALFETPINEGLMHQALVRQQSNRRNAVAHAKTRGEIRGSTRKLFAQKGTGRARRGSIRSPLLRGGSKAFGPRSRMNFNKDMPRVMRRKALFSCLSLQAKNNRIIGLESYPDTIKTKEMIKLLTKLPVDIGRKILFVASEANSALLLSGRNIPGVKVITAAYLNPEDILGSRHIVFLVDAIKKSEEVFGGNVLKVPKVAKVSKVTPHQSPSASSGSGTGQAKETPHQSLRSGAGQAKEKKPRKRISTTKKVMKKKSPSPNP